MGGHSYPTPSMYFHIFSRCTIHQTHRQAWPDPPTIEEVNATELRHGKKRHRACATRARRASAGGGWGPAGGDVAPPTEGEDQPALVQHPRFRLGQRVGQPRVLGGRPVPPPVPPVTRDKWEIMGRVMCSVMCQGARSGQEPSMCRVLCPVMHRSCVGS